MSCQLGGAAKFLLVGVLSALAVTLVGQCSVAHDLRRAEDIHDAHQGILKTWCTSASLDWTAAWQTDLTDDNWQQARAYLVDEAASAAAAVRLCAPHRVELLSEVGEVLRSLVSVDGVGSFERLRRRAIAMTPRLDEVLSIRGAH